ncbi:MAG: hypothetical protein M3300_00615, partial [Actinomycetota bacterium]|nr:hypothetical protein [Actinomycetota bacterium]
PRQPIEGLRRRCCMGASPRAAGWADASAGHAFIQNIRRGHYELATEETVNLRVLAAFDELVRAI